MIIRVVSDAADWHHPDWGQRRKWNDKVPSTPPNMDRYTEYMKGQLKELVTGYGPLGILWFDGEWEAPWTHDLGVDLYHYVRSLQPSIIVNNRVGKARAGMSGMDQGKDHAGDYGKFQSVAIGVIDLAKPGKTTLSVKAVAAGWQPLNLRSIKLTPAK